MNATKDFISLRHAAQLTGLGFTTLRKLADEETIRSYKTLSGQRKFHHESLVQMCQTVSTDRKSFGPPPKQHFLYARVSSKKQLDDLQRQITFLQGGQPEYTQYVTLSDVGSGINFKRKRTSYPFGRLLTRNYRKRCHCPPRPTLSVRI